MTPEEFEHEMNEISNNNDKEKSHRDADKLLCQLLIELGYEKGISIYEDMGKWYS